MVEYFLKDLLIEDQTLWRHLQVIMAYQQVDSLALHLNLKRLAELTKEYFHRLLEHYSIRSELVVSSLQQT
jgi:hypothetical protein